MCLLARMRKMEMATLDHLEMRIWIAGVHGRRESCGARNA